jgi:hypothetical protein
MPIIGQAIRDDLNRYDDIKSVNRRLAFQYRNWIWSRDLSVVTNKQSSNPKRNCSLLNWNIIQDRPELLIYYR